MSDNSTLNEALELMLAVEAGGDHERIERVYLRACNIWRRATIKRVKRVIKVHVREALEHGSKVMFGGAFPYTSGDVLEAYEGSDALEYVEEIGGGADDMVKADMLLTRLAREYLEGLWADVICADDWEVETTTCGVRPWTLIGCSSWSLDLPLEERWHTITGEDVDSPDEVAQALIAKLFDDE